MIPSLNDLNSVILWEAPSWPSSARGSLNPNPSLTLALFYAQAQPVPPVVVKAAEFADNLIKSIDWLALSLGRMLRGLPLARVGVVVYALALHAWLFVMPFVHLLAMPSARAHAHS